MTTADQIRDAIVPFQVQLERIKAGQRRKVLALMRQMEKEIYGEIMATNFPKTPSYKERRLKALLASVNTSISKYSTAARKLSEKELGVVAKITNDFMTKSLDNSLGKGVTAITHGALSPHALETIVSTRTIEGLPAKEWWGQQSKTLKQKFANRIRLGMAKGDDTGTIVRSIRGTAAQGYRNGIMNAPRNQVTALVRTSVQSVANETNLASFKNNELIEHIQWSATFDERTTEICIDLDGLEWDANTYEPVGHSRGFPGPTAHWQCRSVQIPVLIKWEKLAKKNKKMAKKLDKIMEPGTKASMDGPVSSDLNYRQWLGTKSATEVNRLLGKAKADRLRRGDLTFKQLMDETDRPMDALVLGKDPIPLDMLPKRVYPEIRRYADKHGLKFNDAAIQIQAGWSDTRRLKVLGKKRYAEFQARTAGAKPKPPPIEAMPTNFDDLVAAYRIERQYLANQGRIDLIPSLEYLEPEEIWEWVQKAKAARLADQKLQKIKPPTNKRIKHPTLNLSDNGLDAKVIVDAVEELGTKQAKQFSEFLRKYETGTVFMQENTNFVLSRVDKVRKFSQDLKMPAIGYKPRNPSWLTSSEAAGFTSEAKNFVVVYHGKFEKLKGFNIKDIQDKIGSMIRKETARPKGTKRPLAFNWSSSIRYETYNESNAVASTWLHEMGHQVYFREGSKLWNSLTKKDFFEHGSLTRYGTTNNHEFFAEHFVAWLLRYDDLVKHRPTIAKLMDMVMERALK